MALKRFFGALLCVEFALVRRLSREGGAMLLAPDGWKPEGPSRIVDPGGCGRPDAVDGAGFNNRILRHSNRLGYVRQFARHPVMNKTG